MPSLFAELERLVTGEIDSTYGEPTRIEPKTKGQYLAGSADGTRLPLVLIGIPDFNPVTLIAQDTGKYDGLRPSISGDKLHVSYDEALFVSWKPTVGDTIVLTDHPGAPALRVSRVDPDGQGRLVCVCSLME